MKSLLATVLAAVSISAFAAWDRLGSVQVADMTSVSTAVAKLGQMVGNPMVSAAAASGIADMSILKFFGPMRKNSSMTFTLLMDPAAFAKDVSEGLGQLEYAVLYPTTVSKAQFLKRHEGSYETNGVIVVKGDFDGDDLDTAKTYVVFSEDGKWAGASDNIEQCRLALKDIALSKKPMNGDIVRVSLKPAAFGYICRSMEKSGDMSKADLDSLKEVRSVMLGLKVSDLGIDIKGSMKFRDGSDFANIGRKSLADDALAFADKGAFSATAYAEGSGKSRDMTDEEWNAGVALCKKYGIDVAKFLARTKAKDVSRYTFDMAALFKFITENEEGFGKIDFEKFFAELREIGSGGKGQVNGPAGACVFCVKGFESQWSVSERFAATLPEVSGKKPFAVSFMSMSSLLKALVPHALALVPEDQREMIGPALDAFVTESKCGIAAAYWREGEAVKGLMRISADEIRGIGGMATGIMSMGIMGAFSADGDEDEDGDEDGDDAN